MIERIRGILKMIELWIFVGSYSFNVYLCIKNSPNQLFSFILWVLVLWIYTYKNEKIKVSQELKYDDIFILSISTQVQHIILLFVLYFTTISPFSIIIILLTFGMNTYIRMFMYKFDADQGDRGKGIIIGVIIEFILLIAIALFLPYGESIIKQQNVIIYIDRLCQLCCLQYLRFPLIPCGRKR